ncbi:MAG: hypothetical protein KatS3mg063_0389 [Tepidiforma sp.]|jgi:hypothetical protein|uniref:hypothetical protein n=1 Tax=Tepidiforma sp. TaxID=2682230 RepID=UPI0021DF3977|nr:hypothetical protein [Tepidiforma sp.]GIW14536.1 MAG: hypothetical protein KatS3mg063_0389 [Tepidiforma sp.]
MPDHGTAIRFTLETPDAAPGQVGVPELAAFLEGVQRAVTILVEDAWGREHGRGRIPEALRAAAALVLTDARAGSFSATLRVAQPKGLWDSSIAERTLERALGGFEAIARGERPDLPRAAADHLVAAVRPVCRAGGRLEVSGTGLDRVITFDARTKLPTEAASGEAGLVRVAGELLEIDYRDSTAELWAADGTRTTLLLGPGQLDAVDEHRRRYVAVRGTWEDRRRRRLRVGDVLPLDGAAAFWRAPTLEELEARQGVAPVYSLAALRLPSWEGEDEDAFLETLRRWREAS